jgi:hypothetical protein
MTGGQIEVFLAYPAAPVCLPHGRTGIGVSLQAWDRYRLVPAAVPHLCRGGRGLPRRRRHPAAPLILGLALVILLSIPWGFAVARRLATPAK